MSHHTLTSKDKRSTLCLQDDGNLVLYHPTGLPVWASNTFLPPVEAPPHTSASHPLLGKVTATGDSHFADATGEVLPLGATYGPGLERMRSAPAQCLQELDDFAAAGYQFVRTWFTLGWYPFWRGHEVAPHDFVGKDGAHITAWADYDQVVTDYAAALTDRGLRLFWSCGDLQMFDGDLDACARWAKHVGGLLSPDPNLVIFADVNEAWQNWVTNSEPSPDDIDRFVIEPLKAGYGSDFIALRSAGPGDGETVESLDRWAGDISQKHGSRGGFRGDFVTVIRHSRGINYGDPDSPSMRLGIESEPAGSDIDREGHRGMGPINSPEALSLNCAANFMAPYAYVSHTHRGVKPWVGPISAQPGFHEVPRVREMLPADLMSAYRKIVHGGLTTSPFTDAEGFPEEDHRRIDSVLADDGRFVTLVYSTNGKTQLQARWALSFLIYTPHTGEAHPFTMQRGDVLDLEYQEGRLLVGQRL